MRCFPTRFVHNEGSVLSESRQFENFCASAGFDSRYSAFTRHETGNSPECLLQLCF